MRSWNLVAPAGHATRTGRCHDPHRACASGMPWGLSLLGLALLTMLSGCGRAEPFERAAAAGTVTLDGRPIDGQIRFVPEGETQGPAAVATINGGKFSLSKHEGPVVGTHRIEIESSDRFDFPIDDEAAYAAQIERRGGRPPPNPVPPFYNRNSTLTRTVTLEGPNEFEFSLSSRPDQASGR